MHTYLKKLGKFSPALDLCSERPFDDHIATRNEDYIPKFGFIKDVFWKSTKQRANTSKKQLQSRKKIVAR